MSAGNSHLDCFANSTIPALRVPTFQYSQTPTPCRLCLLLGLVPLQTHTSKPEGMEGLRPTPCESGCLTSCPTQYLPQAGQWQLSSRHGRPPRRTEKTGSRWSPAPNPGSVCRSSRLISRNLKLACISSPVRTPRC